MKILGVIKTSDFMVRGGLTMRVRNKYIFSLLAENLLFKHQVLGQLPESGWGLD